MPSMITEGRGRAVAGNTNRINVFHIKSLPELIWETFEENTEFC